MKARASNAGEFVRSLYLHSPHISFNAMLSKNACTHARVEGPDDFTHERLATRYLFDS